MQTEKIFSPFQVKNCSFRNRLGLAPMTRMSAGVSAIPRQDVFEFLIRRAENGAAVVFTEAIVTDYESAQGYPGQARMTNQIQMNAWKPVVRKIREHGALSVMQIFHCGRMAWPEVNPAGRILAPSAIAPSQDNPLTGAPYPVPEEISRFEIEHVINGFVETAKGAVAAGFDGIEIHGAHGYLISQFLSSYSNKRRDGYGGSVANRFRFAAEVIQAVRSVIPRTCMLSFRISNWGIADMNVSLFESVAEWQQIIRLLAEHQVDIISVSTYDFNDDAFGSGKTMARLTREVTELPLMICGKIYDANSVALALNDADVALSGKSMLLDPNWIEGVREGREQQLYSSEDAGVAYTDTPLL